MTHNSTHPRPTARRRPFLCLLLCSSLGLQLLVPSRRPAAAATDTVIPAPSASRKQQAAASNLPDLNELRRRASVSPRPVPPVPPAPGACAAGGAPCQAVSAGAPRPDVGTSGTLAGLAGPTFLMLAAAALNGRGPAVGLSPLDFFLGGGYAVSDAPSFGLPVFAATVLDAPSNLRVTAAADSHIDLAWDPAAGATNYRVEWTASKSVLPQPLVATALTSTSHGGLTRGHSYLYRVCAADGAGACVSAYSNVALGTAYSFENDPIVTFAEDPAGATKVRALHVTQLREAVNSVRHLADQGDGSWTNETLTPQVSPIKADDIRDLRSELGEALSALGLPAPSYTDPTIYSTQDAGHGPTPIRRAHMAELRLAATRGKGAGPAFGPAPDFETTKLDPNNRTGSDGADAYSRNFNFSIPLVSLPGRAGLDLGLTLSYNSLVWTKDAAASAVTFDADRGFPAPGFRLGFPVVRPKFVNPQLQQAGQPVRYSYTLVTPSGARVELRQTDTANVYESADSSYLQLRDYEGTLELLSTDGTRLSFLAAGGEYLCQELRDSNGNYLTVAYAGGQLDAVTDTLGRRVTFHYAGGRLQEIRQAWKRETEDDPNPPDETHKWATFGFGELLTLGQNSSLFTAGLTVAGTQGGAQVAVLRRVGLSDGSYFGFEYNQWGQVWKVTSYAADAVDAQGQPDYSHALNSTWLDLPGAGASMGGAAAVTAEPQSDCPRFSKKREWVEHGVMGQSGEVETTYSPWAPNMASCEVLAPDGKVKSVETYATTGWQRGMTTQSAVWAKNENTGAWETKKTTAITLEHDGGADYPTNPRVTQTTVSDPQGNARTTRVTYTEPADFQGTESGYYDTLNVRLPKKVEECAGSNCSTPLRTAVTDYKVGNLGHYVSLRILGLVRYQYLYEGADTPAKLRSQVGYVYDELNDPDDPLNKFIAALPSEASQHAPAYAQEPPPNGQGGLRWRGNANRVRRYSVDQSDGTVGSYVESRAGFNVTGTVAYTTDAEDHKTSFSYTDSFFQNVNRTHPDPSYRLRTYAYPTTVTDPDGFTSSTWFNYDLGAGTEARMPLPNVANNQPGPLIRRYYDAAGRLIKTINVDTGAYTRAVYPAEMDAVETYTLIEAGKESNSVQVLDGAGRTRATSRYLPPLSDSGTGTYAGNYSGQKFEYDGMGRVARQTNPAEVTAAWALAGEDTAWVYTLQSYDWQGRPLTTTRQADGTTTVVDYGNACGCAGGDVVTVSGEVVMLPPQSGSGAWTPGRRTQRTHHDALGRAVKVEVLNQDGTPYQTTVNEYNARDQITTIREYKGAGSVDGSCPSGTCQQTAMTYDGHGRLLTHLAPEQTAPTRYSYNDDDTTAVVTDPRQATSTYRYFNNRHLVNEIVYGAPSGVQQATTLTFTYDAAGNRKSQTDKGGSVTYEYDLLSRLKSEVRKFTDFYYAEYPLSYDYNLAGQLTSVTYPDNRKAEYEYDRAGQLKGVSDGAGTQYASGMKYRAWGALKEVGYGNGLRAELGFDARMRVKSYRVGPPNAQPGANDVALSDYEYEADGRIKAAYDGTHQGLNRSYLYDLVGRLIDARTTNSAAYFQSYQYDEFNHLTVRGNGSWRHFDTTSMEYLNNRTTRSIVVPPSYPSCCPPQWVNWTYNAAGQVTRDHNKEYTYDAAGEKVRVLETTPVGTALTKRLWIYQDYDADGESVKRVEQSQINSGAYAFTTAFYVRSSVLDDKVVAELNESGATRKSYVYANGTELAQWEGSQVRWQHSDPATNSTRETDTAGALVGRAEFDPLGNDTPLVDPLPPETTPDYEFRDNYSSSGNPYDGPSGCMVDRQPVPCSLMMMMLRFGSGVGRDGGSIRVVTDYGGRDPREFPPTVIRAFQVPGNQINTSLDVDALRDKIKEYNTERCKKFVKDLLTEAGGKGGDDAVYTDLLDLFDAVRGQKGISVGIFKDETGANVTYSTVKGAVGGAKDAQVLLSAVSNSYPTDEVRTHYHASNAIGELTHVAGSKPSGYDYGAFSDVHLAQVAHGVAAKHGLEKKIGPPTLKPSDEGYLVAYTNYYHDILKHFCVPNPATIYQRKKTPAKGRKGKRN